MRVLTRLVLLWSLLLAGCGGGGGEDEARPDPLPASTATVTPIATALPSPSVTTTPAPPFDEVALGIATKYGIHLPNGGRAFQQFALRNAGGEWQATLISGLPREGAIHGVTFATGTLAFAYGGQTDAAGILLRSDDAGRTWHDVSRALPPGTPQIFDAVFAAERVGYLVGRSTFTTPVALATTDGGTTWRSVDPPPSTGFPLYGAYALGFRAGVAEMVRYDGGGIVVGRLDDASMPPVAVDPPGGAALGGMNAFATAGGAGWIAEAYVASIVRSAAPGEPWVQQPIDVAGASELRAIDLRDERHGLAGGYALVGERRVPLVLASDDGTTWQSGAIVEALDGYTIVDVLRLRGDGAIATAADITTGEVATVLLRSVDGGRTWHRDPTTFEHEWQIHDLARNTERH